MNKIYWNVIFLCLLITACEFKKEPQHIIKFDKDTFEREQAAWKEQTPLKYRMEERIFLGIPWTAKFTVEGEEISNVETSRYRFDRSVIWTVSDIYNNVADFYKNCLQALKTAPESAELSIDITYAPGHYPTEVHCSYSEWGASSEEIVIKSIGESYDFSVWVKSFTSLD